MRRNSNIQLNGSNSNNDDWNELFNY